MYFYLLMNKDFIIIIIKHIRLAMDCLSPQSISGAMCGNSVSNFLAFIHFQQRPIDLLKRKSIYVLADAICFREIFAAGTYFSSV